MVIRPNVNVGNTGRTFTNVADFYFDRNNDGTPDAATGSAISAALGFAAALILAFRGKSLLTVAIIASATVLVCELILPYLPL